MNKNINFVVTLLLCISIAILAVSGIRFEIFDYLARFNELPDLNEFVLTPIGNSMIELTDLIYAKIDLSGNVFNDILNAIKYSIDFLVNGLYCIVQILSIIPRIIIYVFKIIIAIIPFIDIKAIGSFGGAWS